MMNPEDHQTIEQHPLSRTGLSDARKRTCAYVVQCDGEHAIIAADVCDEDAEAQNYWAVGQLVTIQVGENRVVGLTCSVDVMEANWNRSGSNRVNVTLELVGEIVSQADGSAGQFSSGISSYPKMGCIAHRIRSEDLGIIYKNEGASVVKVGHLTQDRTIDAKIDVDRLLSRHFAVVGTTGVGKSTSVTLVLRKIIKSRPDIRVLMLDPHNEFATAFPEDSVVIDAESLVLPFWLFKLDELSEVIFRGQSGFDAETEILGDLIPLAKERYRLEMEAGGNGLKKRKGRNNLTADTPVPYRLADLVKLIDDRLGLLDNRAEKPVLKSLLYRLESVTTDSRFRFMFDSALGGDVMEMVMSNIFRVPQYDKPICVLEMSGLPSEVVNSVVSVLCRMAFELAMSSDGGIQTLVVCEEAHRYIPANREAGFWPTRQAIARIAKEGRKYGVYLGIVSQRPGELDPTILSQCNTLFAMRLGNQKDQEIIRGAVANGAKSTIGFLSSIANRECIAFGEAIHTPMRLTFETMAAKDLPGSRIYEQQEAVRNGLEISLSTVMRRMRQEDRRAGQEVYGEGGGGSSRPDTPMPFGDGAEPGDEINAIMNAVYSGNSGTTGVAKDIQRTTGGTAQGQSGQPMVDAPSMLSPPQPGPAPTKQGGSTRNLINSFRRR